MFLGEILISWLKKHYVKIVGVVAIIIFSEVIIILSILLQGKSIALLQPAGQIAQQQKDLMIFSAFLSLFVIIPVFVLLAFILWRYRDGNTKATYRPNWDGSKKLEAIWWGFPVIIIMILAVVTYKTSHSLDPYRPIASAVKPITVQAVALQWKWLFIYPDQGIATVNYLQIPEDTPINFKITADAPMNSLWIPKLGGQVYAMTGMETKLHLIANEQGTFTGQSSNISGEGYAGMTFDVVATDQQSFNDWVAEAKYSPVLTNEAYNLLAKPSKNNPVTMYGSTEKSLYSGIITKYMAHDQTQKSYENHGRHN